MDTMLLRSFLESFEIIQKSMILDDDILDFQGFGGSILTDDAPLNTLRFSFDQIPIAVGRNRPSSEAKKYFRFK